MSKNQFPIENYSSFVILLAVGKEQLAKKVKLKACLSVTGRQVKTCPPAGGVQSFKEKVAVGSEQLANSKS